MPKKNGFTLIELMVVIAIIGILSVIGIAIYANAQKSVRDTRRKGDVDAIAKALEQNYDPLKNRFNDILPSDFQAKKIPTPPEDPNGFYNVSYIGRTDVSPVTLKSFQVCTKLEGRTADCLGPETGCFCMSNNQGEAYDLSANPETVRITSSGSITGLQGAPSSLFVWSTMKTIDITNGSSALTDYQLKITVPYSEGMKTDFGDVRFTDSAGSAELPYWMESSTPGASAVFWVKVPSIPAGASTIKLAYGNPDAATTSNPNTTFAVYDDFNSGSLDTSKWTQYGTGGSISFSNGKITLSGSSSSISSIIKSKATVDMPAIVEAQVDSVGSVFPLLGFTLRDSWNGYGFTWWWGSYYMNALLSAGCSAANASYYNYQSGSFQSGIMRFLWISSNSQRIEWPPSNSYSASMANYTPGPSNVVLGTFCNPYGTGASITVDWARARKYASPEPTVTIEP